MVAGTGSKLLKKRVNERRITDNDGKAKEAMEEGAAGRSLVQRSQSAKGQRRKGRKTRKAGSITCQEVFTERGRGTSEN